MKKEKLLCLCYKHLAHQTAEEKGGPIKLKIFGQARGRRKKSLLEKE